MSIAPLGVRTELRSAGRLPVLSREGSGLSMLELCLLLLLGIAAATITAFVHLQLRVPGSVILRAVFPMALGLALVPRRGSALIAGVAAGFTGSLYSLIDVGDTSSGALTILWLIGPMLELAMIGATQGWKLYLRFMTAGLATNLIAFLVRAFAAGSLTAGSKRFGSWQMTLLSWVLCGAAAGLLSAVVWFRASRKQNQDPAQGSASP